METSKKILIASWIVTVLLTIVSIYAAFQAVDLTTLAGMAWAELTAAHGFYYWKAKNENRAKGTQALIRELAEKYGIDSAAQFAQIIYKD